MPLLLELILLLLQRELLRWQLKLLRLLKCFLRLLQRWRQAQSADFDALGFGPTRGRAPANQRAIDEARAGPAGVEREQRGRHIRHRLPGVDRVDRQRGLATTIPGAGAGAAATLPVRLISWHPRSLHGGGAAGPPRRPAPRCAPVRRLR